MRRSLLVFVTVVLASAASSQIVGIKVDGTGEIVLRNLRQVGEDEPADETIAQIDALSVAERARLATRLGDDRTQAERFTPLLITMLRDPSTLVRAQAAASLARLGEPAFKEMLSALGNDDQPVTSLYANDQAERDVSEYLSWAFANSIADPAPAILDWARKRLSASKTQDGPDPIAFAGATLGARGAKSLSYAQPLLRSKSLREQKLGLLIVKPIGADAASAAPSVARLVLSPNEELVDEAIVALGVMGEAGQVELARLFPDPRLSKIRSQIAYELKPRPASLRAQLKLAASLDDDTRKLAIDELLEQPDLPRSAVPFLFTAVSDVGSRSKAFAAFARVSLSPRDQRRLQQLARAEWEREVADDPILAAAGEAILALASTGPLGLQSIRSRLARPELHRNACRDVASASKDYDGVSNPKLDETRRMVRELAQAECADFMAEDDEVKANRLLTELRAGGNFASVLVAKLVAEDLDTTLQEFLCENADLSDEERSGISASLRDKSWSDLADLADACPTVFEGLPSFAVAARMQLGTAAFERWAEDEIDDARTLLAALVPAADAPPPSWTAQLTDLLGSNNNFVRLWAIRQLGAMTNDRAAIAALRQRLADPTREIAEEAAEGLLQSDPESREWAEAAAVATHFGLERDVELYIDAIGGAFDSDLASDFAEAANAKPTTKASGMRWNQTAIALGHPPVAILASFASSGSQSPAFDPVPPESLTNEPPASQVPPQEDMVIIPPPVIPEATNVPPSASEPAPLTAPSPTPDAYLSPPPPPPPAQAEADFSPSSEGGIVVTGGGGNRTKLPKFPWPPPRYSSIVTFGRELDRRLLGHEDDNLGVVHDRLVNALGAIDPGFESRLFGAPGGFVMLTRLEQTGEDGRPLQGRDRWRDARPPPRSASDFLVRLFLAPPGFYRTIAFLFTDQANFRQSSAPLPSFHEGGTVLPDEIRIVRFGSRHAFALIYSFRKRDLGSIKPYRDVGGKDHLQQSGVIKSLQRR